MTSQLDELDKIENSLNGSKETCVLCVKLPGMPYYSDRENLVLDLVKHSFLGPLGHEKCNQKTHALTKHYIEELSGVIGFIWQSLEQCKNDFDNMGYGFNAVDVDTHRPGELIKLFSDFETMEFVLKRYYDVRIERNDFSSFFWLDYDGKLWEGHKIIESGKYWHKQAKFFTSYRNALSIFKSIDTDWLHLLNPKDYDWYKTISEARARHFDFKIVNIDKNMHFVNPEREKFKQWLSKAEADLGRKLVYKSMEIKN